MPIATARAAYVSANSKSMAGAIWLAVLLGPLGLLYAAPIASIILIGASIAAGGLLLLIAWPLSIPLAISGARRHRRRVAAQADLMLARS